MKKCHFIKNISLARLFFVTIFLYGCGGSGDSQTNNSPSVQYGSDSSGNNDLIRYTDADWLYQYYFGEYGLPNELQAMMMPELKILANGFALQHSLGEDVNKSISKFHSTMQMLYYSGEMHASMAQVKVDNEMGIYDVPEEDLAQDIDLTISDEAQRNIDKAEILEKEYIRQQEQLALVHNLPYALPDKRTKYIIYNGRLKYRNTRKKSNTSHKGLDRWNWWDADFIWVNGGGGFGHMGIVNVINSEVRDVIDADPDVGIQRHRGITAWANEGGWSRLVALRYTKWGPRDWGRQKAVNYAINSIGIPYNWLFINKHHPNKAYCSQLIWQAFKSQGVNLDRNGGLVVWPSDIRYHPSVRRFQSSSI